MSGLQHGRRFRIGNFSRGSLISRPLRRFSRLYGQFGNFWSLAAAFSPARLFSLRSYCPMSDGLLEVHYLISHSHSYRIPTNGG